VFFGWIWIPKLVDSAAFIAMPDVHGSEGRSLLALRRFEIPPPEIEPFRTGRWDWFAHGTEPHSRWLRRVDGSPVWCCLLIRLACACRLLPAGHHHVRDLVIDRFQWSIQLARSAERVGNFPGMKCAELRMCRPWDCAIDVIGIDRAVVAFDTPNRP